MTQPAELADWPDRKARYERRYEQRWADETLASKSLTCWIEGNALKLQVDCPRCGHQLDDFFVINEQLAETIPQGLLAHAAEPLVDQSHKPLRVADVLACNCENEHQGRPEGKRGCGSFAWLRVELARRPQAGGADHQGRRRHSVYLEADRAILRDRAWDEAAERAELERLALVQTHAEKQSGFFTALLGLLSAALIVQGTEHILAKPTFTRWAITVLFALGVAAGAYAIMLIARAARGSSRGQEEVTGPGFYAHTTREIEKAVKLLRRAALPAGLALLFLTVTVALVWLVPPR